MGKVHGSLARAGKVKSQTPKVEPQEKKKLPKGRARKRMLYTRRFVNVTLTGGKRKVSGTTLSQKWRWLTSEGFDFENSANNTFADEPSAELVVFRRQAEVMEEQLQYPWRGIIARIEMRIWIGEWDV